MACYLHFEQTMNYYNYDPKVVNGLGDAVKVNIFLDQIPKCVTINNHPQDLNKQLLTIHNYEDLPDNFMIIIKTLGNYVEREAIKELNSMIENQESLASLATKYSDQDLAKFLHYQ